MGLKYALSAANGPTSLIAAAIATGTLVGFWIPQDGLPSISTGETIMTDVTGTSNRFVQCTIASPGNWLRDSADVPIPGWGRSINSQTNRGNANFMGFNAACAAAKTALVFFKVATAQTAGQATMLASSLGGIAGPQGGTDVMSLWGDTLLQCSGDGGGLTANVVHGDYAGWVVVAFVFGNSAGSDSGGPSAWASKCGGTWRDIGLITTGGEIGYASAWTGFNAWSAGDAARETSNGIVKHGGVVYFSNSMSEAAIQSLLITGHVLTA